MKLERISFSLLFLLCVATIVFEQKTNWELSPFGYYLLPPGLIVALSQSQILKLKQTLSCFAVVGEFGVHILGGERWALCAWFPSSIAAHPAVSYRGGPIRRRLLRCSLWLRVGWRTLLRRWRIQLLPRCRPKASHRSSTLHSLLRPLHRCLVSFWLPSLAHLISHVLVLRWKRFKSTG